MAFPAIGKNDLQEAGAGAHVASLHSQQNYFPTNYVSKDFGTVNGPSLYDPEKGFPTSATV